MKHLARGHQGLSKPTWASPGEPGVAWYWREVSPRHRDSFPSSLSRFYYTAGNSIILPPALSLTQSRAPYCVLIWNWLYTPIEQVASLEWQEGLFGDDRKALHHQGPRGFCDEGRQNKNNGDPHDDELLWEMKTHGNNSKMHYEVSTGLVSWPNVQLFLVFRGINWFGGKIIKMDFFSLPGWQQVVTCCLAFESDRAYAEVPALPSSVPHAEELHQGYNWNTNSHASR